MSTYIRYNNEREALLAAYTALETFRAVNPDSSSYWRVATHAFVVCESIRLSLPGFVIETK